VNAPPEWTRESLSKRTDEQVAAISDRVLNTLAKWRSVFAGWQLGTRPNTDPECQAVRDHRELTMLLRAEVNALTKLLLDAGVITPRALTEQVIVEAEYLSKSYERKFPGMSATPDGIAYSLPEAVETMKGWLP
jgi:hypothetical protein